MLSPGRQFHLSSCYKLCCGRGLRQVGTILNKVVRILFRADGASVVWMQLSCLVHIESG